MQIERTLGPIFPRDGDIVITRVCRSPVKFTVCEAPGVAQFQACTRNEAIQLARGYAQRAAVDLWYADDETKRLLEVYRRNSPKQARWLMARAKAGGKIAVTPAPSMLAHATVVESVARRAYELYLSRGGAHGHDQDDWLQAEYELRPKPSPGRTSVEEN